MLSVAFFDPSLFPLLDNEFDKVEASPLPPEDGFIAPAALGDDLAWEDQLDSGVEVSF